MERAEKEAAVESLAGKFGQAPIAVLADYRGLTVSEITELRAKLREIDGELVVAKNTLTRLAVADTDASGIDQWLVGPTALAFGYEDPAAVAKALHGFAKDNEALELKGAIMEGEVLEADKVKQLALLPGRDELRAKLLALLNTPATQLVRLLNTPGQQLATVMAALRDKLEADGDPNAAGDTAIDESSAAAESGGGASEPVAGDNAPGSDAPAAEEAPAEEAAPAEDEAPAEEAAPAKDETPVEDTAPAEGEAPAEEEDTNKDS